MYIFVVCTFSREFILKIMSINPYDISHVKKGSSYSITEGRVPELIPVLGSQRARNVSHKPSGRLP